MGELVRITDFDLRDLVRVFFLDAEAFGNGITSSGETIQDCLLDSDCETGLGDVEIVEVFAGILKVETAESTGGESWLCVLGVSVEIFSCAVGETSREGWVEVEIEPSAGRSVT